MPRNWFTYSIRTEGKDGTLGRELATAATQRRALQTARQLAKGEALDDAAVVVLRRPESGDHWGDQVIATFKFGEAA